MRTIDVNLKNNFHTIFIDCNISSKLNDIVDINTYDNVFILTQQSIFNLYSNHILFNLDFRKIFIKEFEDAKTLLNVNHIIEELLEKKCSRNSLIIGFGGGVITDIAGFIASIFMRGINHILIPTTLLGMVDASIGGKTGVNHQKSKNLIGTFKQPKSIIIDPNFLHTLSKRHIINGFAEIIKYGLLFDPNLYQMIKENFNHLINMKDFEVFKDIIYCCCTHKKNIIVDDEFDKNKRMILNFGHSIGHALENYYNYKQINHGDAVYYGMLSAIFISSKLNYLNNNDFESIKEFLKTIPKFEINNLDKKRLFSCLMNDKKISNQKNLFILINKIGDAIIKKDIPQKIILESMDFMIES